MKKVLIISAIIIGIPSFALCSIDGGESVCTLPSSSSTAPLFQTNETSSSDSSQSQLQTKSSTNSFGRIKNNEGVQMQGSLGCQFGDCYNEPSSTLLPNK